MSILVLKRKLMVVYLMNELSNIFNNLPKDSETEEIVEIIEKNDNIRIERIISSGQHSPENFWYEQNENEFVILLKGEAELEFEDKTINMLPGDYLLIPALQRHRVKSTSKNEQTIWLAVFYL